MKKIIMIALAILVIVTVWNGIKTEEPTSDGKRNPLDVDITDVQGNRHNLIDYQGKNVVIKVWASWCPICLSGLEEYNELSKTYQDGVVLSMVAPNVNNEMNQEDFATWFTSLPEYEDITVLFDQDGQLVQEFLVRAYPSYVFINEKGEVADVVIGHQSNEQVIEKFEEIS